MRDGRTRDTDDGRAPDGSGRGRGGAPGEPGRRATTWMLVSVLVLLLGLAGVGVYLGLLARDGAGEARPGPVATGDREARGPLAVRADVVDFPTLDGDTASLADYRGKVVLLNLWGTWCPPCRREIPDLVELQERIEPRGGTVIGLAVDSGSPSSIRSFAEKFGINYPIWYSRGRKVVSHYRAMGYPTTLLIDREGIVRERYLGPQTAESLLRDLEPYLSGGGAGG